MKNKVVLVTGAAGGVGAATCKLLAERGARVIAMDLADDTGASLAQPLAAQITSGGGTAIAISADVRNFADVERTLGLVEDMGPLTGIFANAGVLGPGSVGNTDQQTWNRTLDVNVTGVWNTIRAGLPRLSNGGSVVLTSSVWGIKALPGHFSYVTSKHAVVGMMRAMAIDLAPRSIRVNSVHPTSIDTPLVNNDDHAERSTGLRGVEGRQALNDLYRSRHLLPVAFLDPVYIAYAVAWLMSDEARWITGVELPIDGGLLTR